MSCLVIRCRSCTPASTVELTDWLEAKVAELREGAPESLVRLTRLAQDLAEATVDDGWLIEVELPGEQPAELPPSLAASLEEALCDMRILGLGPTVLAPASLPFVEPATIAGRGRPVAPPQTPFPGRRASSERA
jgi:hypothetical protein